MRKKKTSSKKFLEYKKMVNSAGYALRYCVELAKNGIFKLRAIGNYFAEKLKIWLKALGAFLFHYLVKGLFEVFREFKTSAILFGAGGLILSFVLAGNPEFNFKPLIEANDVVASIFEGAGYLPDNCSSKLISSGMFEVRGVSGGDDDCGVFLKKENLNVLIDITRSCGIGLFLLGVAAHAPSRKEDKT